MILNTRIAPSPSGDMHIGTARTAYFNWLAARATGGKFILRIDDTNQEKNKPEYTQVILDTMEWLELDYDEIHYQSKRFDLYLLAAHKLVSEGKAKVLDNGAIALTEISMPQKWLDDIAGSIAISGDDFQNAQELILIRGDGSPTYHFSSVYDDANLGINYILRGVDHISNTARQIAIFNALGKDLPRFAHIGLIHQNGKKLSKRDGAASILHYKDNGYSSAAMCNFLLRMGWGPKIDDKSTKTLDRARALELFIDGGTLKSSSANLDLVKLESFNRKYKAKNLGNSA